MIDASNAFLLVWLPEKDFPVLNPVVNTPVIPQQSLAKPAPEPQEDVEPVTPQALLQLRQLVKEDLDAIPDCDVFSNDAYYFNGFNDEVRVRIYEYSLLCLCSSGHVYFSSVACDWWWFEIPHAVRKSYSCVTWPQCYWGNQGGDKEPSQRGCSGEIRIFFKRARNYTSEMMHI